MGKFLFEMSPKAGRLFFGCLLFVILPICVAGVSPGWAQESVTRASIAEYLSAPESFPLETRRRVDTLRAFYLQANGSLLWKRADLRDGLIRRMTAAAGDGLRVDDYPVQRLDELSRVASQTDARGRAVIEIWFSTYFLKYAQDLKVGRFIPGKIDPKLYWQPKKIDAVRALNGLASARDMERFLNEWQPSIPDYRRLRTLLNQFIEIARRGGWPRVSPGEVLKPGGRDPRVRELRARMEAEQGPLSPDGAADPAVYDPVLVGAVQKFQLRHGLEADGVVGKRTLLQLNILVAERIKQIVVNMERWRWMPEDLGRHYIMVNIAGFELRRVQDGRLEERMRVVVGRPYFQTPVFSNAITYVEINPYWNVPYSIATKEELPKLQKDPSGLAAKGFEAVVGNRPVDVRKIDWSQYSRSHFPIRLRQRPGPKNALGRVKLMFPNKFSVYMHDTPARTLFGRAERAFSHGCIRLARPIEMTEQVLAGVPGWSRQRIDDVLASKKNTRVSLATPLPVHITYATAWLDEENGVQFRSDIYYRDIKLMNAIFGKKTPPML